VTSSNVRLAAGILAAGFAAACGPVAVGTGPGPAPAGPEYVPVSPALPAIPAADGPLDIRLVHPTPGTTRPQVDSTFIFGSVGSGRAALSINGVPVPVAPNGAFLAFLAVPQDGVWSLEASRGTQRVTAQRAYASPPAAAAAPATPAADVVPVGVFERPRAGTVTGGADTLATGSDAIPGRPTPSGSYDWFFPRGTRLSVVERRGQQYRVSLGGGTDAWVAMDAVTLGTAEPPAPATVAAPVFRAAAGGHTEMVVRGARGAPFRVEAADRALRLTVHGVQGGAAAAAPGQPFVQGVTSQAVAGGVRYEVALAGAPWGYAAWYTADGDLVLRVRTPPRIDAGQPLRGIRIFIDPGHPPGGATGPTGMTEAEANLAISLPLAEKLRARGAEVLLSRTQNVSVGLAERTAMAVAADAHLLVSVHNNAFPEGVNPFRRHGTSTYYFHPFSAGLARRLNAEILATTRIPDRGANVSNLALVRPTWMPSALTESLYMMIPEQEAALRDPAFVDRLADAHVRGIEAFLRERAGTGGGPP
jgi:N-acetylmuramoyl-L-alanine amidase